ncbi:xylulokinase [Streptomyces iranensis]|uniref:Xylulose kinase n=1 Tax=Streptomyces iranensis TaxID=576784 RepID=A0A061ADD7_9ACTN|nr:xylulokinase [Streptomyces iranensis]MBP2063517.1 xylulokinase [Streptomyces iranensis]CDR17907.1 Carbohydrate kinase, FGGY [Streptomyces iranensis]
MIIAHDLGTTGDKASLHTDDGRLVTSVTARYATDFRAGGIAEQDPEAWWRAVCQAGRELLTRTGTPPERISAIGFSGQMMGAVLLDSAHRPVRPAMIWADHRSAEQARKLVTTLGEEHAYRLLGHRAHPTYSLAKVMWVRDHEPDTFGRVAHVCLAKDHIVQRLTGTLVTDPSDASSTNAFDQRAGTWSRAVLDAADIDPGLLPEVVPSTTVVGPVRPQAAEETGMPAGVPVVIGGGDGPLAALGAGVLTPEDGAYAYLGSSSWISMSARQPLYDAAMRTMTFNHVLPGHYVPTATMQAGGASLEWIAEVLRPDDGSERIIRTLADIEDADTTGLYFLPHLLGERSPYWNADARGAFVGLSRHHGPAHLARAVLEGVAFNLATCVTAFREAGHPVDRVDAIGGGAASDTWLRILADVWGARIHRRSIVEEANSLGAAVTAAVGSGLVDGFEAARGLSDVRARFDPCADRHRDYTARHQEFLDAYRSLEPWFGRGGS